MIKHEFTTEINAPVEKVFALATDFRKYPEWQEDVKEISQTPDGPTQRATKFRIVRTVFGQHVDATGEVTEFVTNEKFAFQASSGPMRLDVNQTFVAVPGGTKTTVRVQAEPGGLFKFAEGALAGKLKEQFESQSQRFKALAEA